MSAKIIGSNVAQLGSMRAWAENGFVRCVDEKTGAGATITVADARERMWAIFKTLEHNPRRKGEHSEDPWDAARRLHERNFIIDMIAVCRRAEEQGQPSDPSAVRDRNRRRPLTMPVALPYLPGFGVSASPIPSARRPPAAPRPRGVRVLQGNEFAPRLA